MSAYEKPNAGELSDSMQNDISEIDKALANLNERLAGGLHGEFYEGSSKAESSNRHAQLPVLFDVKNRLEAFETKVTRLKTAAAPKHEVPSMGTPQNATREESAEPTELEKKVRDLEIHKDRQQAARVKTDKALDKHDTGRRTLTAKANGAENRINTIFARLGIVEKDVKPLSDACKETSEKLQRQSSELNKKYTAADSELERVNETMRRELNIVKTKNTKLEQRIVELEKQVQATAETAGEVRAIRAILDEHVDRLAALESASEASNRSPSPRQPSPSAPVQWQPPLAQPPMRPQQYDNRATYRSEIEHRPVPQYTQPATFPPQSHPAGAPQWQSYEHNGGYETRPQIRSPPQSYHSPPRRHILPARGHNPPPRRFSPPPRGYHAPPQGYGAPAPAPRDPYQRGPFNPYGY